MKKITSLDELLKFIYENTLSIDHYRRIVDRYNEDHLFFCYRVGCARPTSTDRLILRDLIKKNEKDIEKRFPLFIEV